MSDAFDTIIAAHTSVGYWPLEEAVSATVAADASGASHDSTAVGSAVVFGDAAHPILGDSGTSAAFDGSSNSGIDLPAVTLGDEMSVFACVRTGASVNTRACVIGQAFGLGLFLWDSGSIGIGNPQYTLQGFTPTGTLAPNTDYCIVGTYKDSTKAWAIYVNGTLAASGTGAVSDVRVGGQPGGIGQYATVYRLTGNVRKVGFLGEIVAAPTVASLYDAFTGTPPVDPTDYPATPDGYKPMLRGANTDIVGSTFAGFTTGKKLLCQRRHTVAAAGTALRLFVTNSNAFPITVTASYRKGTGGTWTRATFTDPDTSASADAITIPVGGFRWADAAADGVTATTGPTNEFYTRLSYDHPGTNVVRGSTVTGSDVTTGFAVTNTDQVLANDGDLTLTRDGTFIPCVTQVFAVPTGADPGCIIETGDSLSQSDGQSVSDPANALSDQKGGLLGPIAAHYQTPSLSLSIAGTQANDVVNATTPDGVWQLTRALLRFATWVINFDGHNDIGNSATKDQLQTLNTSIAALLPGGCRYTLCTLPPTTTKGGGDSWATITDGEQTPAAFSQEMADYNTLLRVTANFCGADDYFEFYDAVASGRSSKKWKAIGGNALTVDGTHFTAAGLSQVVGVATGEATGWYPAESDVRAGVVYAGGTKTGTLDAATTATGYTVTVYGPHRVGEVDTVRIDATPAGSVFSGAGGIHVADAHASGDYSNFRSDVTDLAGYSYTVTPTVAAAHVLTSINDETLTDPSGQTVTVRAALPSANKVLAPNDRGDGTPGTFVMSLTSATNLLPGITIGGGGTTVTGSMSLPAANRVLAPNSRGDGVVGTFAMALTSPTNLASGIVIGGGGTTVTGTAEFGTGSTVTKNITIRVSAIIARDN